MVGFADLGDLPEGARRGFPAGLSIAVGLDRSIVSNITGGPDRDYFREYERANALLEQLAAKAAGLLESRGFEASALQTTTEDFDRRTLRTILPHKTVATKAGLGWIGKNALLVTERFGSALRLASVLTRAPFDPGLPVTASRCGACSACAEACPAKAPSGESWEAGKDRDEFFDAGACCETATRLSSRAGINATICGICIPACPWTRAYLNRGG